MSAADRTQEAEEPASRIARTAVAVATILSAAAYLRWSRELRTQLGDTAYSRALVSGFVRERGLGAVRLVRPVDVHGAVLLGMWLVSCLLAGLALRRAATWGRMRGARGVELAVFTIAAAIVPSLVLATVRWPDGRGQLRSPVIIGITLAVAVVCLIVSVLRRDDGAGIAAEPASVGAARAHLPAHDAGRRWAWAFLLLLAPLLLSAWWNGLDALRGFDTQSDHLPRAARWFRLSSLHEESGGLLTPYYPGDFLILVRWMLTLGTDAYTFLPSLAASVTSLVALYGICREMGQPRRTAMIAAAAGASCTVLAYLSTTVQSDTATAAFLLLGVLALLRWVRTTARRRTQPLPANELALLLAVGASLGLAVGTKYSAIPPAAAIFGVAACFAWRASYQRFPDGAPFFNARTLMLSLLAMAVPAALCAGYWLLRNAVMHGNPLYPVSVAGLPGVDMRVIIPVKQALVDSPWHRMTYPWVQWDFAYVYDDGLGAAFAAVAIPGFLIAPFRRAGRRGPAVLVWMIAFATYVLWIGTGSITARFGLFPVLLTFAFIGQLWQEFESAALKLVTLLAFGVSIAVTVYSLAVGAVYTTVLPMAGRAVPAVVDSMPAARIFNATAASNRYWLLGADYRHEVTTLFRAAQPGDVTASNAEYVLLSRAQVPAFTAALRLRPVARNAGIGSNSLSLWRVRGLVKGPP